MVERSSGRCLTAVVVAFVVMVAWATPSLANPARSAGTPGCSGVVAIGDSVMLGAASSLRSRGVRVDAKESRSFSKGAALARGGVAAVVIHLGSNGGASRAAVEQLVKRLSPTRVVLVTIQLPDVARYRYEASYNAAVRSVDASASNVVTADWNRLSSGNRRFLARDGIHLDGPGIRAYTDLVVRAACG